MSTETIRKQFDPAFLSAALRCDITAVEVHPIDGSTPTEQGVTETQVNGYMADVFRLVLTGKSVPASVILKHQASDPQRALIAERFHSYAKEHDFYQHLASVIPGYVPACYYSSDQPFVLLLEDLGLASTPGQSNGATHTQCDLAITSLAHAHNRLNQHLEHDSLKVRSGFAEGFDAAALDMQSFGIKVLNQMIDNPPVQFMRRYAQNANQFLPLFNNLPMHFSHMDYRNDNLVYRSEKVVIIDWGESCIAPMGFDLGYYLVTSISVSQRRERESALLRSYLAKLDADYGEEALKKAYLLSLPPAFYLAALIIDQGDIEKGQLLAKRCLAAIEDHLPELSGLYSFH
ncbi:MAG: hypothetical protein ACI8Z1_000039 [Candidatus Azotimanducaceae bacterium]|jgi:hypothetical protein